MRSSERAWWAVAVVLLATAALIGGLAACGSHKESQQEAERHLCTSLDDFAASVVALQGLSLRGSSGDDVKSALERVTKSWHDVVNDAKDVKTADTATIKSAFEDLRTAIEDRPTDEPLPQVIAGLESKITAFARAWKSLVDGLKCNRA
jgi:hypothetical protein